MRSARLAVFLLAATAAASDQTAGVPLLHVRLTSHLTSYQSKAGSEFTAVVIAPYIRDHRVLLPQGSIVSGRIKSARHVGLGVFRERASIDIEFNRYELADGRSFPMRATLRAVDNARESVSRRGSIKGILAANNPQSFVHGVWHRPRLGHFPRSFVGLTGAGGRIASAYSLGPIGAAGLFAIRLAMFRLPEPEIQLPAGSDLHLSAVELPPDAPSRPEEKPQLIDSEFAQWLAELPADVTKPGGEQAADKINIVFAGSQEQVMDAFRGAGWHEADPLTPRTFSRAYRSYTGQAGYPAAPVSKLLYEGEEPAMVFQKSFNTIAMRHHIRVWQAQDNLWLGAATHDIGVKFNKKAMTFTHKIDRRIDLERAKVINDLSFAGCVETPQYVTRPGLAQRQREAEEIVTDGQLAVLTLRSCETPLAGPPPPPSPPQSRLARIARRMMLEGRQYALRGNAYYWIYRAVSYKRAAKEDADD